MRARKRFGQHFLEAAWADKLIEAIAPARGDRFIEIGPGPGALTLRLAPRVGHLTAIEVDRDLASALAPQLPPNVDLIVADFLDFDPGPILDRGAARVAGNLPYNISSPILFRLIEVAKRASRLKPGATRELDADPPAPRPPDPPTSRLIDATLMLQREVAERLEARPGTGEYGVLSIAIQLHAEVRRVLTLPPGAFRPAPKVHSAVVRLTFRPPPVPLDDPAAFEEMVRSMFTMRRKTLGNALRPFAESRGAEPVAALEAAGIDPVRRPETLTLEELARLAGAIAGQ